MGLLIMSFAVIGFVVVLYVFLPHKQWDRKMENPPPPPNKKCKRCNGSGIWADYSTPLHTYQLCIPCSGTGYFNPPKQTGT